MAKLFTPDDASDVAYRNIREAREGRLVEARRHCEYLWQFYERYADPEFLIELRSNFQARYWEMFLTTSLILAGHSVTCPKPGPDVGIVFRGKRIWFEAVSPGPGNPDSPDFIPYPKDGEAHDVPNEKIVLRYLNSISEKYERQYPNWLKNGAISEKHAFIIAINPRNIPFEYADTQPPRLLQAAYNVGAPYVTIEKSTMKAVGSGFHFRDHIEKSLKATDAPDKKPAQVQTGVFQSRKHDGLSGLLLSRADSANLRGEFGDDFELAPNPHATVPLPDGFRLRGTYYAVTANDGYQITPEPSLGTKSVS